MNDTNPTAAQPLDLDALEALALGYTYENGDHWYCLPQIADGITYEPAAEFITGFSPATALAIISQARAARQAQQAGAAAPADYTVDDSELARKIMVFLGRATTQSMDPGADPLRDRLAEKIALWRPAAPASAQLAPQAPAQQDAAPADADEAMELLESLIASIEEHGNYSEESTLTFLNQIRQCIAVPIAAVAPSDAKRKAGAANAEVHGPKTFMTDEQAFNWAWTELKKSLGAERWNVGDEVQSWAFFKYGWDHRTQLELQRYRTAATSAAGAKDAEREEWSFSTDEENYRDPEPSRIAIIRHALAEVEAADDGSTAFWIGKNVRFVGKIDASWIIEQLQEQAYDECGEWAETYLEGVTKEEETELEGIVNAWAERVDRSNFWTVTNVEHFTIESARAAITATQQAQSSAKGGDA